ncbi:MAG: carbohydrate binding domain-containing protein [Chloroflexi bacterium]|nr:carbohydrate binding domain-containing protein [Chloroflexota bacterium]
MSKPDLGLPERSPPRARPPNMPERVPQRGSARGKWLFLVLLFVLVIGAGVGFFALPPLFDAQGQAAPRAQISAPSPIKQTSAAVAPITAASSATPVSNPQATLPARSATALPTAVATPAAPATTVLGTPTATFTLAPTTTPAPVSKTLATKLNLSVPGSSQQVTGTLQDQAGVPVKDATIEFSLTALEGGGLFAQYTLTGTVPSGATQANVGFRVNTECGCAGTSEFLLYDARYVQGNETTNRVPNSRFMNGLDRWGFWGNGSARLKPSDQGQGQRLHVTATRSQTAAINSTTFPVSPGTTYTVTFSARVSPVSAGSGYFDLIFLKTSNEGTRKQIPLNTATVRIGDTATDQAGSFRFPLPQLASGKFLLEARYSGDKKYFPATASAAVLGPTPVPPTPIPADLVWFGPNFGSRDYAELFTKPEQWSEARGKVDVFKFDQQSVLEQPCVICGDNILHTFVNVDAFRKLNDWGIATALTVGTLKEWGCTGTAEFRAANVAIQNIQANGGVVTFLDMDEPFMGGRYAPNPASNKTCGYSTEQSANVTALFIRQVKAAYPNIRVGDTEPYPLFSVDELEQWTLALEARGVTPAYFHLDVDPVWARERKLDVAGDLRKLSQFFQERGIPFGVIFISEWTKAGSDRAYFDSTMEWIRFVNAAIGKTPHVIFNSWQAEPEDRTNKYAVDS